MKRVQLLRSAKFSSFEFDTARSITNPPTNNHWSVAQLCESWIYAWTLPQDISQSRFCGRR
ncbi:hypothetical protein Angca_000302, partial [Angiostrongylus cantonensis]